MSRRIGVRAVFAVLVAAALVIVGLVVPGKAADAATRSTWDAIAQCESGGNWSINTGNGYYGGLQFTASTWRAHGGTGSAAGASRAEQIRIGTRVVASQGWGAWGGCASRLGLRGRALPKDLRLAAAAAAAKRIKPCAARALKARYVDVGTTAGARYADLVLVNTGKQRCRLVGAARMVRAAVDRSEVRVGTLKAAAFKPAERTKAAAKHPRLVLRANGGRAYSRIPIKTAAANGKHCRRTAITVRSTGSTAADAAFDGLRLQACTKTGSKILSLQRPVATRSVDGQPAADLPTLPAR